MHHYFNTSTFVGYPGWAGLMKVLTGVGCAGLHSGFSAYTSTRVFILGFRVYLCRFFPSGYYSGFSCILVRVFFYVYLFYVFVYNCSVSYGIYSMFSCILVRGFFLLGIYRRFSCIHVRGFFSMVSILCFRVYRGYCFFTRVFILGFRVYQYRVQLYAEIVENAIKITYRYT